ncbi:hypothetical protein [Plantactinospora soyae]|uniref:Uncharacterized protein n=1 Tax=Plantactinospora soyae TaxID=1544732 RepID=A0A927R494_9ACTN|nr:hypothetical protein [Plantactinospora soyae]MBE1492598.1 hypothetical protein [Plantactinospora soyae]
MNPFTRLVNRLRRPLLVRLVGPPDQIADALRVLADIINRRDDMDGRRIRVDLTIRETPNRSQR